MAEVVRVGIVGCGRIAAVDHVPGYLELESQGCRVTALCDPRPEQIDRLQEEFPALRDAQRFERPQELFAAGVVDAVTICVPNDLHRPLTVAACRARLHVLCEKPMATTLEEATEMIEAARGAGVVLHINQSLRYNAQYQGIVQAVKQGAIGDPIHVRCIRATNETPNEGWSPGADWFVQRAHQGGLLADIGIHMADLMRMIMGEAEGVAGVVETRRADIDVPDNVNALFRYRNGGTGVMELSWTLPGGASLLEVYGTKGRIRMGFSEGAIELWRDDGSANGMATTVEPAPQKSSQAVFLDALRGVAPSLTPGEYGRRALALCVAIQESSERGIFQEVRHFERGVGTA